MSALDKIKAPIVDDLSKFEEYFSASLKSKIPLLTIITNYILRRKGKMMRPMLVLLTAKLNGEINESSHNAAAMIELLHTATLVHDDVVDESYMRRGYFSINALWNSKIAVLLGDFLYAKGLLLAVDNKEFDLLHIVADTAKEMSEGELLQIQKARKLDISEDLYFEIIKKKTASLIASCAAAGASSVNTSKKVVADMKLFGEKLGIAFQIKDDLIDFDLKNNSGKPSGNDLKEKKLTLPLIYALQQAAVQDKKKIISLINKKVDKKETVLFVIDFVVKHGGIDYAMNKMNEYKNSALAHLDNYPDCDAKISLREFVEYVVNREK